MAWFGGPDPVAELDNKIEEATSESIPNGDLDIAVGLEITDMIRSKKVPPKTAMRCLKKRLTKVYSNPNLLTSTLKLTDLCVKNCGSHFIAEINSKEFVDYLVDYILKVHYDVKAYQVYSSEAKYSVGNQILKLIKEWTLYFQNQESNYLDKQYQMLVRQGYDFPEVDPLISQSAANFVDSEAPPDWIDGNECMICYTPFSMMNRKHHCRACGSVFCQAHSSHSIPLVSLGIMQPVRVCDDCYQIHKNRNTEAKPKKRSSRDGPSVLLKDDEEEQIRKAIELSLKDTQIALSYVPPATAPAPEPEEEMDDDLKAAIAASLQDTQPQNYGSSYMNDTPNDSARPYENTQQEPELDFYLNIMPNFNASNPTTQYNLTGYQAQGQGQGQVSQFSQVGQNQTGQVPQFAQVSQNQTGQVLGMTPAQHIDQHKQVEDLTPQEEEDINLFIQLMNGVKNDRSKQVGIIYDKDLGDLHSRVTQLKPKINRALRNAIEKYEFFLDMNNKISTISRLYDQYLETKLNQAYSKHYVTSPYKQNTEVYGPQRTGSHVAPEPTSPYGQAQNNVYGHTGQFQSTGNFSRPQTTGGNFQAQATGGQYQAQATGGRFQTQNTGEQFQPQGTGQRPQGTGQFEAQNTGFNPQATGPLPTKFAGYQPTGLMPYPMEDSPSVLAGSFAKNKPSEPDYGPSEPDLEIEDSQDLNDQSRYQQHQQSKYEEQKYQQQKYEEQKYQQSKYEEQTEPNYADVPPTTFGNYSYPSEPKEAYLEEQPLYPSFPEYPTSSPPKAPEATYPLDDNEVSDTDSVASRYPPVAGYSDEEVDTNTVAKNHASMRYPEVEELERAEKLPEMPKLARLDTADSKKYKSEPEPLIEL